MPQQNLAMLSMVTASVGVGIYLLYTHRQSIMAAEAALNRLVWGGNDTTPAKSTLLSNGGMTKQQKVAQAQDITGSTRGKGGSFSTISSQVLSRVFQPANQSKAVYQATGQLRQFIPPINSVSP